MFWSLHFPELRISPSLASYMRMAHDAHYINASQISKEMKEQLEKEYQTIKGNQTVEQLYEQISLRFVVVAVGSQFRLLKKPRRKIAKPHPFHYLAVKSNLDYKPLKVPVVTLCATTKAMIWQIKQNETFKQIMLASIT